MSHKTQSFKSSNLSSQWQEENQQHEMTQDEIREIAKDVIIEVKKSKRNHNNNVQNH